jgi:hypothetical protein
MTAAPARRSAVPHGHEFFGFGYIAANLAPAPVLFGLSQT